MKADLLVMFSHPPQGVLVVVPLKKGNKIAISAIFCAERGSISIVVAFDSAVFLAYF